jgi:hypothetical protein
MRTIKKAYEDKEFEAVEEHERAKKCRLDMRKASVLEQIQQDKEMSLEKTREFRIKNRSYSMKKLEGMGSKIVYNGSYGRRFSGEKGSSSTGYRMCSSKELSEFKSVSSSILLNTGKPSGLQSKLSHN